MLPPAPGRALTTIVVVVLGIALLAWRQAPQAKLRPGELRLELLDLMDTGTTLPPDAWLATLVLVNDSPYRWSFAARAGEPELQRELRGLQGWEPAPGDAWHGGAAPSAASAATARTSIRPGEKIPLVVFGNQRRGVQRFALELRCRAAGEPVRVASPPISRVRPPARR